MTISPLLNLVLTILLIVLLGWLLVAGKAILLPVFIAAISVFLLVSATEALRRLPILGRLPVVVLRFAVLAGFTAAVLAVAFSFSTTVRELASLAPLYEARIDRFVEHLAARANLERHEFLDEIRSLIVDRIDLRKLALGFLSGVTSLGSAMFLAVVYAIFLFAERDKVNRRVAAAFADPVRAEAVLTMLERISAQIRGYLTYKTLINILLAGLSCGVLLALGIDFAVFWAVLIGLLNYIPFFGSYIAVAFPVLLSLAQFGNLATSTLLLILLGTLQLFIGNYLEPRLIGRQLNLSPFVVLISLSVWTMLWGIPGAILAVPMTSILAIVLAGFDASCPVAAFLVEEPDPPSAPGGDGREDERR